jgi:hypothetical protein
VRSKPWPARRLTTPPVVLGFAVMGLAACSDDPSATAAPTCEDKEMTLTTAAGGAFVPPTLADDGAMLASSVAESFCSARWTLNYPGGGADTVELRPVLPPAEAACVGDGLVDALGAERVRQSRSLGTWAWSTLGFGLSENLEHPAPISREDADAVVDVFARCTESWELLLVLSSTEGADDIGEASAACVTDRLDDDIARTIFASELDRAYDDPGQPDATPFPESIEPLVDVYEQCLTTAERAQLDFG